MLYVLEGCDAAGKATQSKLLEEQLNEGLGSAQRLSFPDYDSETGKLIKGLLATQWKPMQDVPREPLDGVKTALLLQSLMLANMSRYLYEFAEAKGDPFNHLVCDRYCYSRIVYGAAAGLNLSTLVWENKGFPVPDLAILLNCSLPVVQKRLAARGRPLDSHEGRESFLVRVIGEYRSWWDCGLMKATGVAYSLNADRSVEVAAEDIWQEVVDHIERLRGKHERG